MPARKRRESRHEEFVRRVSKEINPKYFEIRAQSRIHPTNFNPRTLQIAALWQIRSEIIREKLYVRDPMIAAKNACEIVNAWYDLLLEKEQRGAYREVIEFAEKEYKKHRTQNPMLASFYRNLANFLRVELQKRSKRP